MLNRVVLIGRLTRDPELRYTASGVAVTRFSVAVDRRFKNQQGEREADFINIVTWRGLAENCANYLKKGSLIGLEGRIQTGKYENQEGRTVYTTEVVADDVRFLESKRTSDGEAGNHANSYAGGSAGGFSDNGMNSNIGSGTNFESQRQPVGATARSPFESDGGPIDISEDDLPF